MWAGWPAERILYLFLGVVSLAVAAQVTLMHWRQNFRHWSMWTPVIETPLLAVVALLLTWVNSGALRSLLVLLSALSGLTGLVGTYYHWAGVGEWVDGYTLNNFMVGPPVALPLLVSALGALGLIAVYLMD